MTDLELAQAELARLERMAQRQRHIVARLMADLELAQAELVKVGGVRAITPSTQFASLEQHYPFAGE